MLCASRPNNILVFSSPVKANFPNVRNKRILLGNISINSEYLPRDLMWIMNRKGKSAQHPGIRFLSPPRQSELILKRVIPWHVFSGFLTFFKCSECSTQGRLLHAGLQTCEGDSMSYEAISQVHAGVASWAIVRSHPSGEVLNLTASCLSPHEAN